MNKVLVKTGSKIPQARSLMSSQSRSGLLITQDSSLYPANITQIWPPQKARGFVYSFFFSCQCISVSSWWLKQHNASALESRVTYIIYFKQQDVSKKKLMFQSTSTSGAEYFTNKMHHTSLSLKQTTATNENAGSICMFSKEYLNDSKWVQKYVLNPLIIVPSLTETHSICWIFKISFKVLSVPLKSSKHRNFSNMRRNEGKMISTKQNPFYNINWNYFQSKALAKMLFCKFRLLTYTHLIQNWYEGLQGYSSCRLAAKHETETTDCLCNDKRDNHKCTSLPFSTSEFLLWFGALLSFT